MALEGDIDERARFYRFTDDFDLPFVCMRWAGIQLHLSVAELRERRSGGGGQRRTR